MQYVIYNRSTGAYYANPQGVDVRYIKYLVWETDIDHATRFSEDRALTVCKILQGREDDFQYDLTIVPYAPTESAAKRKVTKPVKTTALTEHLTINETAVLCMIFSGTLDSLAEDFADKEEIEKYPAWVCNAIVSLKSRGMLTIHLWKDAAITEKGRVFVDVLSSLKEPTALTVWSMK